MSHGDDALSPEDLHEICYYLMNEEQQKVFEELGEVDFSWSLPQLNRYRVNVYRQRGSCTAALRMISNKIPGFEELHLPEVLHSVALKPRGLFLVTGPTGSGKSTTLACTFGSGLRKRRMMGATSRWANAPTRSAPA